MSDRDGDEAEPGMGDGDRPANKVARLIDAYDLGPVFGDRLEDLWTAEGEERESLRSLADRFNRRLLEAAMTDAGMLTVDGEVSNIHRLMISDDVSSGVRTEAKRRLKQEGVDVEQLERDLVTYQAIRSYLRDYRGVDYEHDSGNTRIESVIGTVQRLQSRTRSVVETSLGQLRDTDRISLGEFRLFVEINVHCEDCNTQYAFVELLERRGCECE